MMDTWGTTRIPQPGYGSVTATDSRRPLLEQWRRRDAQRSNGD